MPKIVTEFKPGLQLAIVLIDVARHDRAGKPVSLFFNHVAKYSIDKLIQQNKLHDFVYVDGFNHELLLNECQLVPVPDALRIKMTKPCNMSLIIAGAISDMALWQAIPELVIN